MRGFRTTLSSLPPSPSQKKNQEEKAGEIHPPTPFPSLSSSGLPKQWLEERWEEREGGLTMGVLVERGVEKGDKGVG